MYSFLIKIPLRNHFILIRLRNIFYFKNIFIYLFQFNIIPVMSYKIRRSQAMSNIFTTFKNKKLRYFIENSSNRKYFFTNI